PPDQRQGCLRHGMKGRFIYRNFSGGGIFAKFVSHAPALTSSQSMAAPAAVVVDELDPTRSHAARVKYAEFTRQSCELAFSSSATDSRGLKNIDSNPIVLMGHRD